MQTISSKNQVRLITVLFTLTYMVSYITRINYGAIIAEMENATSLSRAALSLSLTGSFITYGLGQIISGIIGDKFSPKKLVAIGLGASAVLNMLIPLCSSAYSLLAVWCINGFAQSFMWPPMVKLMTALLSEADYKKTTVMVSCGSSFGTIAVYLLAPLVISWLNYKWVFVISALCGFIMLVLWQRFSPDFNKTQVKNQKQKEGSAKILLTPLMITVMFVIVLQGSLRDGVTTWMPSYISETYSLSSVISILTGVVLPLFSIACFNITEKLYSKLFTNPISCAGIIFSVGALSAALLCVLTGKGAIYSVLLSALLTGTMHGVNLMLVCMVPAYFKKYGNVSTASGIINSCTYIGSAISTYGIAAVSESYGWNTTLWLWFAIALVGSVLCFACVKPWSKTMAD